MLETKLSVPSNASVFTLIGPHSPDFWESISQLHHQQATKTKVCACYWILSYRTPKIESLLPLGLHFFFSFHPQDEEAPVNKILRGECLSKTDSV